MLHRVGILLDFAAGFLLAPELIGSRRLGRLELALEAGMVRAERGLSRVAALVPRGRLLVAVALFILGYIFGLIAWAAATLLRLESERVGPLDLLGFVVGGVIFYALYCTLVGIGVLLTAETKGGPSTPRPRTRAHAFAAFTLPMAVDVRGLSPWQLVRRLLVDPVAIFAVGALAPLAAAFLLILRGTLVSLRSVAGALARRLAEEGRLAAYMVSAGVVCFVGGNLLQLASTF